MLPKWDNQTANYNLQEHNWPDFWLNIAKEKFPYIDSLEKIHDVCTPDQIVELGSYLQKATGGEEFINRIDSYYNSIVPNLIDQEEYMIQRFFTVRIVIPNQAKAGRLLQFHKDEWTGNGLGILTLWTPITKCYGSNSMQILSCEDSDFITDECVQNKWSFDKIQLELFMILKVIIMSRYVITNHQLAFIWIIILLIFLTLQVYFII